ncbi:MAG: heme exporter protein CcmD [Rhodospirillaceae bacterium]|nr:heme exporter protein CcmD [Rhodospirillaceae bacterium]
MDGLAKFLAMGGYAAYVWPALGLATAVLAGLLVASARSARQREAELARLEAEAGPRVKERGDEG